MTQRPRGDIVGLLVNLAAPLHQLAKELDTYPPDPSSDHEIVTLTRTAAENVLSRYIRGEIGAGTVTEWAKLLEGRTDVAYEPIAPRVLARLIFRLANEEAHQPLTEAEAQEWIDKLWRRE
jgi:hypothetical protein